jgi:hypothetical protein
MDQKSIALYLGLTGMNALEIHHDRVTTHKDDAKTYALTSQLALLHFSPLEMDLLGLCSGSNATD